MDKIQKQFFETFEIKLIEDGTCDMDDECRHTDCSTCQRINKFNYPPISDHILLQLICINNNHAEYMEEFIIPKVLKTLKEQTLHMLISNVKDYTDIKHQVQTVFEEGLQ